MSTTTNYSIKSYLENRYTRKDNKPFCVIDRIEAFKKKWDTLSKGDKLDFLTAYNECRYNPSRNALVLRSENRSKTNLTLDLFEQQIFNLLQKITRVEDNHFKERVQQISVNTEHPSRTPLHNMVAYLMCDNNYEFTLFTFIELERYFNFNETGQKRNTDEKKVLANQKTDGGKIPLEMIFPKKGFFWNSCPMNPEKIGTANKIIQLLGPYVTNSSGRLLLINDKLFDLNEKYGLNLLPKEVITPVGPYVPSGGYRKRKTHRKTRKTRKTRK
jgi:hypothetical protein